MMIGLPPLRRSMLYVAGHRPEMIEAARRSAADVICLDLEDNVPPEAKPAARANISAALRQGGFRALEVIVRINPAKSSEQALDCAMLKGSTADGVLIPKVSSPEEAQAVFGETGGIPGWCMVESALGLVRVEAIAAQVDGIQALVVGAADFCHSLGIPQRDAEAGLALYGPRIVAAARAFGLTAIEGITSKPDASNPCGYDGRSWYRDEDVLVINRCFSPSELDVEAAKAALHQPYAYGDHLVFARRTIALAERAAAREAQIAG